VNEFLPFLRKKALFEGKWGHREGQTNLLDMENKLEKMVQEILQQKIPLEPAYIYGIYNIEVRKDTVWLDDKSFAEFPRMENGDCIADLYRTASGKTVLPVQLVTLGQKVTDYLTAIHLADKYSEYYEYHSFFAALTDALADYVHNELTSQLSVDGDPVKKLRRFSFGYPLCSDLSGNKTICELLNSKDIGVMLNETYQMEPIYTTCAILTRWE
jgi:5-methyltetrahydrofolate--homocysteine methyltransferase